MINKEKNQSKKKLQRKKERKKERKKKNLQFTHTLTYCEKERATKERNIHKI